MKIEFSREADAIYVYFREVEVTKSQELEDGVVIDLDNNGHIVGIEILNASKRLTAKDLGNINIENLPVEADAM
ncbi:MAG: DUF2283 domain-containing protein [Bacteroidia bacterium]|nr:DUF2283 domain-containing protein [Bacteroidia bacterium]